MFHNRGLALLTTLLAAIVGAFAPRAVPIIVVVAFFAGLNAVEASSSNVWLIVGNERPTTGVGALPHYMYVPNEAAASNLKRGVPTPIVIQRMNISAFVTDNYAKTIVESAQKNSGDVASLATFSMNIPET